jgi:hypothetical protein
MILRNEHNPPEDIMAWKNVTGKDPKKSEYTAAFKSTVTGTSRISLLKVETPSAMEPGITVLKAHCQRYAGGIYDSLGMVTIRLGGPIGSTVIRTDEIRGTDNLGYRNAQAMKVETCSITSAPPTAPSFLTNFIPARAWDNLKATGPP